MKAKPGRLERVLRLVPYYGAGLLLGAGALYAESRLLGTVLLVPSFNWTSRSLPGAAVASPAGEYSLAFKHTRLDWRLVAREAAGVGPVLTLGTKEGWRLRVWERAAGTGPAPWGAELTGAPGLLLADDGTVRRAVRVGAKDVTLEFSPPAGVRVPDDTVVADMAEIARSLKPSEMKTGSGG